MRRISDTEYEIMDYVWSLTPPFTTASVMEAIGNKRGWKMQTAITLLNRLMEQGFIRAEKAAKGRERLLYPVVTRDEYLRFETDSFVSHYHKNSVASLIGSIRRENLTERDLDELSALVESLRKGDAEK